MVAGRWTAPWAGNHRNDAQDKYTPRQGRQEAENDATEPWSIFSRNLTTTSGAPSGAHSLC